MPRSPRSRVESIGNGLEGRATLKLPNVTLIPRWTLVGATHDYSQFLRQKQNLPKPNNIKTIHFHFFLILERTQTTTVNNIKIESKVARQQILSNANKRINEIKSTLPNIDQKISGLKVVISEDIANLKLLETDSQLLKERAAIPPTLSQVIHSYNISIIDFEFEKNNLES